MFCINCGKELAEGSKYCIFCGKPIAGAPIDIPIEENPAKTAQTPDKACCQEQQTDCEKATLLFCPKRFLGQWMLRSASIEAGNAVRQVKIGRSISMQVHAGLTEITCYGNYLGKTGLARATVTVEAGKCYEISYRSPLLIFLRGRLSIRETVPEPNSAAQAANADNESPRPAAKKGKKRFLIFAGAALLCLIAACLLIPGDDTPAAPAPADSREPVPPAPELTAAEKAILIAKSRAETERLKYDRAQETADFMHRAMENHLTPDTLYRNPDGYIGKEMYIGGTVLQAIYSEENPRNVELRIDVISESENTVVYAFYTLPEGQMRVLEDDYVDAYGIFDGLVTYTAVSGAEITLPAVRLEYLYDYADVGDVNTSPEYERVEKQVAGVFITESGGEMSFPVAQSPDYCYLSDVTEYEDCTIVYYEPDIGWDESDPPPFYRLTLFADGAIVVFEPDKEAAEGYYSVDEGTYTYCTPKLGDTSAEAVPTAVLEEYTGVWWDSNSQRCHMEISYSEGSYFIDINWASGAEENTHWSFIGTWDLSSGGIAYADGACYNEYYLDNGTLQQDIIYLDGEGALYLSNGTLYWQDNKENAGQDCVFEKAPA